ncbi:hypothetical protein LSAT2_029015 [Lamellibrachia satsuma]|nr:hypothetical protein LSAT2_029015 [Lamellibrachia satsuma]
MLGDTATMPWMGQSTSGGAMYTRHDMSIGASYPLRPPPPLIDMRNLVANSLVVNRSIPPANCSVQCMNGMVPHANGMAPRANGMIPPNCSAPSLNCQAAAMTYRTVPVAMQEDYARRCYMRGYWTSPSYPQQHNAIGAAYAGPCCMGPTSVYTDPKASNQDMQHSGVTRTGQQQKCSVRYAPYPKDTYPTDTYPKEMPAQSNGSCSMPPLFSANRAACDVDTAAVKDAGRYYSMMQADTWAAQSESTKRLAEKIWRRCIETQSYLDELNVHRRMSSCVVTQQILDEELVRCYSGSVERAAAIQTHSGGRRMCPPFVSTSPPMTACAQVNAGQNAYYPLCVNITPSEPSTTHVQQNRQNTYSVLCENMSPQLPGACGNLWASSYRQPKGETLPVTNSGQSASGALLPMNCAQPTCGTSPTSICAQPTRGTSSTTTCAHPTCGTSSTTTCAHPTCGTSSTTTHVQPTCHNSPTTTCAQPTCGTSHEAECSNIETVEMIYFRKYPCNFFKKQPVNLQDTNPSTVAHVEPLESSSPRDHLSANAAGEHVDREHVDSAAYHTERHSMTREQPCVSENSTMEHNASSILDSSFGSVDSCDDRLYIHIPLEDEIV